MEVKAGYKQTEVGVIPEDWLDPQLQEITEDNAPICYGIVKLGSFTPNGVPVLVIKDLNQDYTSDIYRSSHDVERAYTRSRIQPNDVLISGIRISRGSGPLDKELVWPIEVSAATTSNTPARNQSMNPFRRCIRTL